VRQRLPTGHELRAHAGAQLEAGFADISDEELAAPVHVHALRECRDARHQGATVDDRGPDHVARRWHRELPCKRDATELARATATKRDRDDVSRRHGVELGLAIAIEIGGFERDERRAEIDRAEPHRLPLDLDRHRRHELRSVRGDRCVETRRDLGGEAMQEAIVGRCGLRDHERRDHYGEVETIT